MTTREVDGLAERCCGRTGPDGMEGAGWVIGRPAGAGGQLGAGQGGGGPERGGEGGIQHLRVGPKEQRGPSRAEEEAEGQEGQAGLG